MRHPTGEQVERAAEKMREADIRPIGMVYYRLLAEAAAPHLQLPWEEATDQEISMIAEAQARDPFGVQCAVVAFVNMRNAALLPKPVDPRRKKIAEILMVPVSPLVFGNFRTEAEVYADRILAALDEVK